jgi:hypothetical protein
VAQSYPPAFGYFFEASYDSQSYGGGIQINFQAGKQLFSSVYTAAIWHESSCHSMYVLCSLYVHLIVAWSVEQI